MAYLSPRLLKHYLSGAYLFLYAFAINLLPLTILLIFVHIDLYNNIAILITSETRHYSSMYLDYLNRTNIPWHTLIDTSKEGVKLTTSGTDIAFYYFCLDDLFLDRPTLFDVSTFIV